MYIAPVSTGEPKDRPATAGGVVNDAAPDIRAQVLYDQLETVYATTGEALYASMVAGILMTVLLWGQAPHELVLGWLVPRILIPAVRLDGLRRFRRDPQARNRVRYWTMEYIVAILADTVVWAALPIVFMPYGDAATNTLLFGAALAVAGAGVNVIANHFSIGVSFVVTMLAPLAVDQAIHYGRVGLISASVVLIYMVLLIINVKRSEARMLETLRLRYQNAWNAEQRAHALELAEQSSAAKTRFLAAVSHEIRTPLNGMFGMAQLLRASVTGEKERKQLQVFEQSARYLRTVIGDLLDMSRIEFGKLVVERDAFAVEATVCEVTDLLAIVAADKGLAFSVTFDPALPQWATGDASRIKQVLHNLIGNAIKFTPANAGHGSVTVHATATGGGLRFTVSDNGEGIRPDQLDQIFHAFAQVGSNGDARRAGTGLGLTISRQLARAMGGDVSCVSRPGEGAEFSFHVAAPAAVAPSQAQAAALPSPMPRLAGRVLLVDDNAVNALVATTMLELMGLCVDRAEDGEEALARLAAGPYDVVLMDCLMPGIDGLETTRRWRATETAAGAPRVPIIALTASAVAGDRERCLAAGMDDHLTKPFEQSELITVLERHLPQQVGAAAPVAEAVA